jgi:hypothetical protein
VSRGTCKHEGCELPIYSRDICKKHWQHWYKTNPGPNRKTCTVEGCEKPRAGGGLCHKHYQRERQGIKPSARLVAYERLPDAEGFLACVDCDERRPHTIEHFATDKRVAGGLRKVCRVCTRKQTRSAALKKAFGITLAQKDAMRVAQGDVCLICERQFNSAKGRTAHVDHNHKTGAIRGLLCHHCNVMLGHAGEDIGVLQRAIAYLRAHAPSLKVVA